MRLRAALKIALGGRFQSRWNAAVRTLNNRGFMAYPKGLEGFVVYDQVGGRLMFADGSQPRKICRKQGG